MFAWDLNIQSHAKAAKRVAAMHYSGIGTTADKWKAHKFYAIAANAGDAEALNALGTDLSASIPWVSSGLD